jgi:hypothetical protein
MTQSLRYYFPAAETDCLAKVGNPMPELLSFDVTFDPDHGGPIRLTFEMRRVGGRLEMLDPRFIRRRARVLQNEGFGDSDCAFVLLWDTVCWMPQGREVAWLDGF